MPGKLRTVFSETSSSIFFSGSRKCGSVMASASCPVVVHESRRAQWSVLLVLRGLHNIMLKRCGHRLSVGGCLEGEMPSR